MPNIILAAILLIIPSSVFAAYSYTRTVTVSGGASGVPAGSIASIAIDTKGLQIAGKLRSDRNDLRLMYNGSQIDRILTDTGTVLFKTQASVGVSQADTGYSLIYGNASETTSPQQNPASIYPYYNAGDSISAFNVSGATPAFSPMPKVSLLKYSANPVLKRTAGTYDYKTVRDLMSLSYENGWYYMVYDGGDLGYYSGFGGWASYIAKSQDLINWTKIGPVITPSASGGGSCSLGYGTPVLCAQHMGIWTDNVADGGSSSGAQITKGLDSKYYMTYLATPMVAEGVPAGDYTGFSAQATSITGPYTKTGQEFTLGTLDEFNQGEASPGLSKWYDGSLWHVLYSAGSGPSALRGIGHATSTGIQGPWTNHSIAITNSEQIENPMLATDGTYYYLFANHVQSGPLPPKNTEYTDAEVMYWSTSPTSWDVNNKTTVISPSYGAWDGWVIGLMSAPAIRNGMLYAGYDGRTTPIESEPWGEHLFRDGGMVEANWPPQWGQRFSIANGSSLTSTSTYGDGILRITARMSGSGTPSVGLGTASGTRMQFKVNGSESFYVDNNGSTISSGFQRVKDQTKTFEIRRNGTSVTYIFDGTLVSTTTGPTGNLPIFLSGDVTVESITFQPNTLVASALGTETAGTIDPPPVSVGYRATLRANIR